MKIAILGYAGQGVAAYEYWSRDGNELTICDRNETVDTPEQVKTQLGPDYLKNLDGFDLLIRTPALHPKEITAANPQVPDILSKVTTVTNEFLRVCPTKNIIGVTGTKGKGTTSTLIAKMLEASGKRVHLGGNIGIPPLDMLKNNIRPDDWVVLELANFQLIDLQRSPYIAVCLMVVPEHMDWHKDMDEYLTAKHQLFAHQTSDDIAVFFADNDMSTKIAESGNGVKIPYYYPPGAYIDNGSVTIAGQEICKTDELKLIGKHNWQNICAAVTVAWQITKDTDAMRQVAISFSGLEHRLELVREHDGVLFYNDSFAATPEAAAAAIEAIPGKKVMIIGGFDRQLDLSSLVQALQSNSDDLRKIVIIGAASQRIADTLSKSGIKNYEPVSAKDMASIVQAAKTAAKPGDAVVLSPGFPSFDMFKNFEDRGQQYKEIVASL